MSERHSTHVFSIAAGVPFLKTLAASLMDGSLVDGFRYSKDDPLSLASATIYVPTRRAARVLRSEFVDLIGSQSAILPTISPLGETEEDSGYFELDVGDSLDLLVPISGLERTIELARLILAWRNQLPEMLLDLHSGSPLVAPASPADAIWLARSLAELIDAVETEEADWSLLKVLENADHALWWQLTAKFLEIASRYWPARLAEMARSSPARHRNQLLRNEAARIARDGGDGPVVVAGSTGSVPATADLIAAISRIKSGAVVLPGLDFTMNDDDFDRAGGMGTDGLLDTSPASRSHPQYGLYHLLKRLGVDRSEVTDLTRPEPDLEFRNKLFSVAMAPSEATADWTDWRLAQQDTDISEAFADVALIEAASERLEAAAIAVALKLAVSGEGASPDAQAALVTPDRDLARRVGNELARFGIVADDSAGLPLLSSPQGSLAHLALEASLRPGDPVALAGLLKHPLVRLGMDAPELRRGVSALERIALRGGTEHVSPDRLGALLQEAITSQLEDRHPPFWRTVIDQEAFALATSLAQSVQKALEPLVEVAATEDQLDLSEWARRSGQVLEALACDERGGLEGLWSAEAGDSLASLLKGLIDSPASLKATGQQWIEIMIALMAGEGVKPRTLGHPRIFIWGTLEARLQSVDTLILGGMNEGIWPGQTVNNPFLSRMMKTTIGLEPPERRIGQIAHDFMMAAGTRKLVLTRALRQGSTPTVPSRFLQRTLAITGDRIGSEIKSRGAQLAELAAILDIGPATESPGRPEPRPPAELQPTRYSFSEVSRLRRDPYDIYARRILKLDPVEGFNKDPGAQERGTLYHAIFENFICGGHIAGTPAALAALTGIANDLFDKQGLPAHVDAVWRPRFMEVAKAFLAFETSRLGQVRHSFVEQRAKFEVQPHLLTVSGLADRIDVLTDGTADIIDYKTGLNPSIKVARTLLDPQLALEAAALAAGAFEKIGAVTPRDLIYVRLKPGNGFKPDRVNNEDPDKPDDDKRRSALQLAEESISQLAGLVADLRSGKHGFRSRLIPARQNEYGGDFDHLARVAEWAAAEEGPDNDD